MVLLLLLSPSIGPAVNTISEGAVAGAAGAVSGAAWGATGLKGLEMISAFGATGAASGAGEDTVLATPATAPAITEPFSA